MSDLMLHSVLNMPPELWNGSSLDVIQRHGRYKQASQRIAELENVCRLALEAMQWDVGGEPIHSLEVEAIAELKRVLSECA